MSRCQDAKKKSTEVAPGSGMTWQLHKDGRIWEARKNGDAKCWIPKCRHLEIAPNLKHHQKKLMFQLVSKSNSNLCSNIKSISEAREELEILVEIRIGQQTWPNGHPEK